MDYGKIMEEYVKYWNNEYMDIDLANRLINCIPMLVDKIAELEMQKKFGDDSIVTRKI